MKEIETNEKEYFRYLDYVELKRKLHNLESQYMKVYDEYYETGSRDSAFIKDLMGCIDNICVVYEVYTRDEHINPYYAKEKLLTGQRYLQSAINYFEAKLEE